MQLPTDPTSTWQPARISRKRYERMIDAGVFDGDGVVEWFGVDHLWRLAAGAPPEHFTIHDGSP